MITIEVHNSICKVLNITSDILELLRTVLYYTIDPRAAYFSGIGKNPKRYLIKRDGTFPTGLLYLVESTFTKKKIPYRTKELRRMPRGTEKYKLRLRHDPYPEQIEAAKSCQEHGRGIVCAPTGVGKSLICALIIDNIKVRTIVIVPTLELKRQTSQYLKECFGDNYVGEVNEAPIAVENIQALNDRSYSSYDCVIIDEFHHSGSKTYREANTKYWNHVYYKFGLTATPFRAKDSEKLLLESVLSKVIYSMSYKNAVDKGYIVPVESYYVEVPEKKTNGRIWTKVYEDLVVNNEPRNEIIAHILSGLLYAGKSTLCLVKEIQHGININWKLYERGQMVRFVNGVEKGYELDIQRFSDNPPQILIGTNGIIGEGIDTKPAEYVIIAGLGKSKVQFMQQVGRGVRRFQDKKSCKIILLRDDSHRWTLSHFKEQVKILKQEYGVVPIKLEISKLF